MKNLLMTSVMLFIAITLFSCKGDQGDPGAQGPAGANGVSGLSMTNVTITPGQWSGSSSSYVANAGVSCDPASNVVEIYWSTDNATFSPLPVYSVLNSGDELNFGYAAGYNIGIDYFYSSAPASTLYFNIAIIPQTQVAKMKLHGVDLNDYNRVKAYIQLNSK